MTNQLRNATFSPKTIAVDAATTANSSGVYVVNGAYDVTLGSSDGAATGISYAKGTNTGDGTTGTPPQNSNTYYPGSGVAAGGRGGLNTTPDGSDGGSGAIVITYLTNP